MSKNNFFKKLLIGGLCALTATAMIGATACKPEGDNGDDPKPPVVTTDEYTISFNLDGGSWSNAEGYTVKVEKDGTLPADLEAPTKDDYTFGGWHNGSTAIIPGVTKITSNMTLTAHWNEVIEEEKTDSWYPEPVGNGAASPETFEANSTIAETSYFEIKTTVGAKYDIGASGDSASHQFSYTIDGNTIDQAVRLDTNIAKEGEAKSVYTVTAKETCVITLYLNFVNASHNSDRGGAQILYSLNGNEGNVSLYKESVARANYVTLKLEVAKNETLTLGVNNQSGNTGVLWLYGAKAEDVAENAVAVNYYDGTTIIAKESVASGATLTAPKVKVFEEGKEFDGWYTAAEDGEKYTFGALTSADAVNVYAVTKDIVVIEGQIEAKVETNKKLSGLSFDNPDDANTPLTKVENFKIDFVGSDEDKTKIATVTISAINNENTTDSRIRVLGGTTLVFELDENYTYTIIISASSSGKTGRKITLTGPNEYSSENKEITNTTYVACTWDNLVAGSYTATMDAGSNNMNIQYITVIATPVTNN